MQDTSFSLWPYIDDSSPGDQISNSSFQSSRTEPNVTPPSMGDRQGQEEFFKQKKLMEKKFSDLIDKSNQVLFQATSFYPFDLFPDEIAVNVNQIDIKKRELFSEKVHSFLIKNLAHVTVHAGILFSDIIVSDAAMVSQPIVVKYLKHSVAEEGRRIIEGLMVSARYDIDLTKLQTPDFKEKVKVIGQASYA